MKIGSVVGATRLRRRPRDLEGTGIDLALSVVAVRPDRPSERERHGAEILLCGQGQGWIAEIPRGPGDSFLALARIRRIDLMFLSYIHSFRAFAILLIVGSHCYGFLDWEEAPWQLAIIKTTIENSALFFVFISGFLFQHLSEKYDFKRYIKRKLLNVISPYIIVSIPMILLQYATHRGSFRPDSDLVFPTLFHNLAFLYLTGYHILPFYFIPMLGIYYLLAPLLVPADRDGRIYWLLPVLLLLSTLIHRPVDLTHAWHSAIFFFSVYLFGMWFSRYREKLLWLVDRYFYGLVAMAAILIFAELVVLQRFGTIRSRTMFSMESGVVDINFLHKVILCGVMLGLLCRYETTVGPKLSYLASLSFGIFFVHMYFTEGIELLFRGEPPAGNLLLYALLVVVVMALSVVSLTVAKKILGRYSRMVVGC